MMSEIEKLEFFQAQFAKSPKLHHLNNAGLAPITLAAKSKVQYWAERFYEEGFWTDHDYMKDVASSRELLSKLIGCQSSEIAFFTNASSAISQIAFSYSLSAGDQVLMLDQEYSSHLYPWQEACKRAKADLVLVESNADLSIDTQRFLDAISSKTKVVAFSWVQFQTGAMLDYAEVTRTCKERGIFVFVDVAQGLGILDCDLWELGVDAIAGGSHKWMLSPVGVGFLAVRKEMAIKLKPLAYGAYTFGTCDDPSDLFCSPKMDASRFESGSKQVLEITALGASTKVLLETTPRVVRKQALLLTERLHDGLERLGCRLHRPQRDSYQHPIVNFTPPENISVETIANELRSQYFNFAIRGPGIRLSPQAFNTHEEINGLLNIIDLCSKMK